MLPICGALGMASGGQLGNDDDAYQALRATTTSSPLEADVSLTTPKLHHRTE
jgi:hypothetical protein